MAVDQTSEKMFREARKYLVGGVASSLHKSEFEPYPIYAARGSGSRLWDMEGKEYIDYMGSFGPSILGFAPAAINRAVVEQLERGTHFALPTESLNELSRKLTEILPGADLVGYQSTGTEANLVNFRLARAFTGKKKILKFEGHYHGWADELSVSVKPLALKAMGLRNRPWKNLESPGQLEDALDNIFVLPWNDLENFEKTIKRHRHELAAVITEPVMFNAEPVLPRPGYLEGLRRITRDNDVLLIFDEVITGFRLALGGAAEYYGVVPDLVTYGKAMAAGYPIAGVGGRREIMESGVHPAGTFNANPLCVAASLAAIGELEKPGVYEGLARITGRLVGGVRELGRKHGVKLFCDGLVSVWQLQFGIDAPMRDFRDNFKVDKAAYQKFYTQCLARGVRLHPSRGRFYISTAHTEKDIDLTLGVFDEVFGVLFG
ncbi:MAG: aspartate aminotransferase family protein [Planctomycetota bacterium]|jgi:glutamate-1-semialdehyde 2,1-aminomutase|nr:aspartate aminotransferase family protein [Planctomycetota bacterium]